MVHEQDPDTPVAETIGAFAELVQVGKVGEIGASNVDVAWLEEAIAVAPVGVVQNSYSLLDRESEDTLAFCAERGIRFEVFGPLAGGWLAGKYRRGESPPAGSRMTMRPEPYEQFETDAVYDGLERLEEEARARGVDMPTLALRVAPLRSPHLGCGGRTAAGRPPRTVAWRGRARPDPGRARWDSVALSLMLVLNQEEVERLLDMEGCIGAMEGALGSLARGEVEVPLRFVMSPDGTPSLLGLMPAHRGGDTPLYSLKTVAVFPENPTRGLDAHQGTVTLFDGETGEVRVLMNASAITAIRTAAVSAVATKLLAREESKVLAILGAGVQARSHLEAMRLVRDFETVRIASRTAEHAEALAAEAGAEAVESAEEAVRDADVVVTATSATEPVLFREWLKDGAHVNAVGGRPPQMTELDVATVAGTSFFVDRRESAEAEAGDYRAALEQGAIGPDHIRAEIGEVLIGASPGRTSPDEVTVFRSLGLAVEDLAAAEYVVRRARESGVGTEVPL